MEYHDRADGIKILSALLKKRQLVPVFGSGFTKGAPARKGCVPDGEGCKELFKGLLSRYSPKAAYADTLPDVADALYRELRHHRIDEDAFLMVLRDRFTGVKLSLLASQFLQLPWPFAFTINIDDGIGEKDNFYPILPYQKARAAKASVVQERFLYKLHGDAAYELKYEPDDNLVFHFDQYVHMLAAETNKSIREAVSNAFLEFNLLFIGCSLSYEPDLKHIFRGLDAWDVGKKKNFLLTRSRLLEQQAERLEDDYGITDAIVVDDYERFYTALVSVMNAEDVREEINRYPYKNPDVVPSADLKYFTGANIFDEEHNQMHTSELFVLREDVSAIEQLLEDHSIVFVSGGRFSGKTALLCALAARDKEDDVYFFPSRSEMDADIVQSILSSGRNRLLLFDDNALSSASFFMLRDMLIPMQQNACRTVVALNRNETYPFASEQTAYHYLSGRFT